MRQDESALYSYTVKNLGAVCDAMTCSGHGTCVNGECVCERLYSGEICQNKGS